MEIDRTKILDNISLEIEEGAALGIIGVSGAGKSILLNILRGSLIPTAGKIIYTLSTCENCGWLDRPSFAGKTCPICNSSTLKLERMDFWKDSEIRKRIRDRTAIMLQRSFALYSDDTVIDNVLKSLEEGNFKGDKIQEAVNLLKMVNLSHRMFHRAGDLSGGEKQRVVLVRQIAKSPIILFADEPTGTLDEETADLVEDKLLDFNKKGNTLLLTSHWTETIRKIADKVLYLEDGRVRRYGEPNEIIDEFLKMVGKIQRPKKEIGAPILRVKNLTKKYVSIERGIVNAVNGISFEVNEGEIFGLIGRSGGGKTTTSRIVAGIIEPTAGEVFVRIGDEWVDMTIPGIYARGKAKQYIGLLHQEYDLFPYRTVLDNLTESIGLDLPKELAIIKARYSLKSAGFSDEKIDEILDKFPYELSVGEKHRVALAQVLVKEPRIIILDEPTGTMDPITQKDIANSILSARSEENATFLIVSHDIDFVKIVCDRVAFMREGEILGIGEPSDIINNFYDAEREKIEN
ncbi:MAG TPA: methyl coenzyme M reductase system, component A2 [Halobacteria archaeon]|nr:methyl coenzyme M reductase system, component A2 [Halobacteria archaeon]